jgi:hypothetical protein
VRDVADYVAHLKALIALNPQVVHWAIVREEIEDELGLFRYRLALWDGGLLEMFERFQVVGEQLSVSRYSFHWLRADGQLHKRWDNAAHRPELSTCPCHIHQDAGANVLPHSPIHAEEVLTLVAAEAARHEEAI